MALHDELGKDKDKDDGSQEYHSLPGEDKPYIEGVVEYDHNERPYAGYTETPPPKEGNTYDNTVDDTSYHPGAAARAKHNTNQPQRTQQMNNHFFTLDDALSSSTSTMSRLSTAVDLLEFKSFIEAELKGYNTATSSSRGIPGVTALEAARIGTQCNIVAIHMTLPTTNITHVYLLPLDSGEPLQPRISRDNGHNHHLPAITTVLADTFDEKTLSRTMSAIMRDCNLSTLPIFIGMNVIPHTLKLKDDDSSRRAVNGIAYLATCAINNAQDKVLFGATRKLKLPNVQLSLGANVMLSDTVSTTATGLPIRSDVSINITLTQGNNPARNTIGTISGYIDMVYAGERPIGRQDYDYRYPDDKSMTVMYNPLFVLTDIRPETGVLNLGVYLFSLAMASLMNTTTNWYETFRPTSSERGNERSISYVAVEHRLVPGEDPNGPIPLDAKFPFDFLMRDCFYPNMFYAIDIEEAGELTWLGEAFIRASKDEGNHDTRAMARREIIDQANALTNNYFNEFFSSADEITVGIPKRIQLGSYENGEIRDIRDIDHLTLLTKGGPTNPDLAYSWSSALLNHDEEPIVSLGIREGILKEVDPNFKVTRYATRVMISGKFITALVRGLRKNNIAIDVTGLENRHKQDRRIYSGFDRSWGGGDSLGADTFNYNNRGYGYGTDNRGHGSSVPVGGIWRK